jgi:hypothetical protein
MRLLLKSVLAVTASCLALGAQAVVNDIPYYDLYPGNDDGNTSIDLCGISDCSDTSLYMTVSIVEINPAGSGVRDTFLRVAQNEPPGTAGSETTESGYNTDLDPLQDDANYTNQAKDTTAGNGDDFNHAVLLSDLQVVDGKYQIYLDVNEPGGEKDFIRLDEFELHMSTDGLLGQYTGGGDVVGADSSFDDASWAGLVYDMDWDETRAHPDGQCADPNNGNLASGCGGLILGSVNDPTGNNGSGDEDYLFDIPVALFAVATASGGKYLHLVSTFGESDLVDVDPLTDAYAEANFEEWTAIMSDGSQQVPIPGTALLFGAGLLGLFSRRRISHA